MIWFLIILNWLFKNLGRHTGRALLGSAPLKLRGGDGELRRPPSSPLLLRSAGEARHTPTPAPVRPPPRRPPSGCLLAAVLRPVPDR